MRGEHAQEMLTILSLDPSASLVYSQYTDKWFVSARIEIANGATLQGMCEHSPTVHQAINDFLNRLKQVGNTPETRYKEALKAHPDGEPHYYIWNGAAFALTQRPDHRH